ncbi:MAG TPA: SDR family NAD(P)-dependent oxidoreductase [Abditibacteriaceae bacterium]|jgi:short-subunit dehydrogenase
MKTVLILGATSGLARALATEWARRRYALILAARDAEELETIAADLRVRFGANVQTLAFDAINYRTHPAFWKRALAAANGEIHGLCLCFGTMFGQEESAADWQLSKQTIDGNYSGAVSILNIAADYHETRTSNKRGWICVVSSVAGDRGRQSNYIYGSAKGAVSIYAQGLRQRLAASGTSVTTIKPGPLDTSMTWGLDKLPLLASPEKVAKEIVRAVRRRADIVYTPAPWKIIMTLLCLVPEKIWKRAKL